MACPVAVNAVYSCNMRRCICATDREKVTIHVFAFIRASDNIFIRLANGAYHYFLMKGLIMQFRVQGQKIQCIRSVYNPETKRSRQTVVYTMWKGEKKVPAQTPGLTNEERQELEKWLAAKVKREEFDYHSDRVMLAAPRLRAITKSIFVLNDVMVRELNSTVMFKDEAAAVWAEIEMLEAALERVGFPRTGEWRSQAKQSCMLHEDPDLLRWLQSKPEGPASTRV